MLDIADCSDFGAVHRQPESCALEVGERGDCPVAAPSGTTENFK